MAARSNAATESAERELLITRVFNAHRSLVFKAWTEPQHLVHWWGPRLKHEAAMRIDRKSTRLNSSH